MKCFSLILAVIVAIGAPDGALAAVWALVAGRDPMVDMVADRSLSAV